MMCNSMYRTATQRTTHIGTTDGVYPLGQHMFGITVTEVNGDNSYSRVYPNPNGGPKLKLVQKQTMGWVGGPTSSACVMDMFNC